ncbi:hypothetical protein FMM56_01575 [Campylobacter sp. LR264d]|uniref:hypothetical protein n=1 Tax=Campylobacter sp. LR264d TaxID=2593544 RepID=UPI00123999C3|nr:hypothetical protein [Campylobacter sp. LR264d]KAA6233992.1 hypothetical protein FMM56_01575 [Campylobacter sp. LR264d]
MWIDNTIDFEKNPNLICENGKYAIMSVAYFWVNKKCFEKAKNTNNGSIDAITNIINKHTDSYKIRQEQYQRIKNANIFKNFI